MLVFLFSFHELVPSTWLWSNNLSFFPCWCVLSVDYYSIFHNSRTSFALIFIIYYYISINLKFQVATFSKDLITKLFSDCECIYSCLILMCMILKLLQQIKNPMLDIIGCCKCGTIAKNFLQIDGKNIISNECLSDMQVNIFILEYRCACLWISLNKSRFE